MNCFLHSLQADLLLQLFCYHLKRFRESGLTAGWFTDCLMDEACQITTDRTDNLQLQEQTSAVRQHSFLLRTSACCLDLDQTSRHLYGLQFADGRSECRAFVRVVCSAVQRSLSDAESLSGDPDPSAVQGLLREADKQRVYTPQVVNQKLILEA